MNSLLLFLILYMLLLLSLFLWVMLLHVGSWITGCIVHVWFTFLPVFLFCLSSESWEDCGKVHFWFLNCGEKLIRYRALMYCWYRCTVLLLACEQLCVWKERCIWRASGTKAASATGGRWSFIKTIMFQLCSHGYRLLHGVFFMLVLENEQYLFKKQKLKTFFKFQTFLKRNQGLSNWRKRLQDYDL